LLKGDEVPEDGDEAHAQEISRGKTDDDEDEDSRIEEV